MPQSTSMMSPRSWIQNSFINILSSSRIDVLDLWAFVKVPLLIFDLLLFDLFDPYNRRICGYQFDIRHIHPSSKQFPSELYNLVGIDLSYIGRKFLGSPG